MAYVSKSKKEVRARFNAACTKRDKYKCRFEDCTNDTILEVHHITNRVRMPNGGYVKENGITLCPEHHKKIEFLDEGLTAPKLYAIIGSSYEAAGLASLRLK